MTRNLNEATAPREMFGVQAARIFVLINDVIH